MVIKINKRNILFESIFLLIMFQNAIMNYTHGNINAIISHLDEVLECLMIIMIILKLIKRPITLKRMEIYILLLWMILLSIGFISNIFYPMQRWIYNIIDALICSRFIVYYFWVRLFFNECSSSIVEELAFICKILSVAFTVLVVHDIFFTPFFPKAGFRYFTEAIQLFFLHSIFAIVCFSCSVILILEMGIKKKNNMMYVIMLLFCMCMTLRMKAIASAVVLVLLYVCIFNCHIVSQYVIGIMGALCALIIGWNQFSYYYLEYSDVSLRSQMMIKAVEIANETFPLGTGFATYGSSMARDHYSTLYTRFGFDEMQGGKGNFLCDTFWPTVIGQAGWIGAILFILIIIEFFIIIIKMKNENRYFYLVGLSVMAYELISSTSETAFFNSTATMLFMALALLVNINCKNSGDVVNGQKL